MPIAMILNLFTGNAKKPLLIALVIAIALLVLTAGYFYAESQGYENGYTVAEHKFLKEKEQAVADAVKEIKRESQSNLQIAEKYWKNELAKKPKIQTIEKRIIKYAQAQQPNDITCQLDDNELFILQDLVSIANGAATQTDNRPGIDSALHRTTRSNIKKQKRPSALEKELDTAIRRVQGKT